jgi:anti-anti-sigma factor
MDGRFRVTVEPGGVVRVAGELDMATADEFARALQGLGSVTIECSKLTFLDSSGIKVLVLAHRRAVENGWGFSMVGLCGAPLRVLQVVELETLSADVAPSGDKIDTASTAGSELERGNEEPAI